MIADSSPSLTWVHSWGRGGMNPEQTYQDTASKLRYSSCLSLRKALCLLRLGNHGFGYSESPSIDPEGLRFRSAGSSASPRPPHYLRLHHAPHPQGAARPYRRRPHRPTEWPRSDDRACLRVCHQSQRRPSLTRCRLVWTEARTEYVPPQAVLARWPCP